MLLFRSFKVFQLQGMRPQVIRSMALGLVALTGLLLIAAPALAHHPFGGQTPANAWEGFLSGLGHPVVGLDHLAFVVATGLLAAAVNQGWRGLWIPAAFVITTLGGTGLHLLSLSLPAPELVVSASVLLFGLLLAIRPQPRFGAIVALAALAGLFHGYAYGEAIVGAEMTPVTAYLLGFSVIQMGIAGAVYSVARSLAKGTEGGLNLRFAGFTLAGVGAAFLSGVVLG